jgi:ribonuclease D
MHSWIDTPAALASWIDARTMPQRIGLDTEFMRTNTFAPRLALAQICVGGEIALLDSPRLGAHEALAASLRDARNPCVMHSAGEDLEALASILPRGPATLFDTQIAAAMAGLGFGLSYQKLVALLAGVDVPKAETRSDWLLRPLSAAQLEYAAQDVVWLPRLHDQLAEKLEVLGRSAWLAEDCRALIERSNTQPDPEPQRTLRGAADWPLERQALLRRLLRWRDARARTLDKPKPWILDDAHALQLAAQPPRDAAELFERSKGLRALRGPQRQELLDLLLEPLTNEDLDFAPIPRPLDLEQRRALASMREAVAAIAAQLLLPEGLLCARRHLETLLTDRRWPAALEGWRRPLLHDVLMAKLP